MLQHANLTCLHATNKLSAVTLTLYDKDNEAVCTVDSHAAGRSVSSSRTVPGTFVGIEATHSRAS